MSIKLLLENTAIFSVVESWERVLDISLDRPLSGSYCNIQSMTGEEFMDELYDLHVRLEEIYLKIN